ncbi:sigma-70 family RNA polymerase sigma factor [Janthinobacterium sp. AD80]|uniref:sigma-70 family RNA polymerase sigma factor n=1 Tax=Janthinobacterium sp. AD80 TaxID=1528773 RepID=UPI000C8484EE|nr:putative RNA polymerase sigma factor FecI [Janthinobacterium sp. AD80]
MPAADFALQQDHSSPMPAAQALYQQHHGWLYGWLRYKLGNAADAADLAHDTFIRILAGRDIAAISQPRAYLTTVARGILINWYQRQALERAYLDAIALLPEAQAPSCEAQYLILETLHQVDAMLDALPAVVRRAFLLSQLEGLTYDAIAVRLDISLASVKRYMKQAFLACLQLEE